MNNTYQREGHRHYNLKQTNKIPYNNLLEESIIDVTGLYRVRQRIGRFLSVKKIKSTGYHDTVTSIRKYIL